MHLQLQIDYNGKELTMGFNVVNEFNKLQKISYHNIRNYGVPE